MDQELALEGAPDAAGVAEVVDRRAARGERIGDREGERVKLRALQHPHRPQRVDPRAEERLIGVDVPHSRDVPLVEQEGPDRRAATAGEPLEPPRRQMPACQRTGTPVSWGRTTSSAGLMGGARVRTTSGSQDLGASRLSISRTAALTPWRSLGRPSNRAPHVGARLKAIVRADRAGTRVWAIAEVGGRRRRSAADCCFCIGACNCPGSRLAILASLLLANCRAAASDGNVPASSAKQGSSGPRPDAWSGMRASLRLRPRAGCCSC
jgi:hypothetical protein